MIFKYFRNGLGFILGQHPFSHVVLGVKSSNVEYLRIFSSKVKFTVTNNDKMQLLHEIDFRYYCMEKLNSFADKLICCHSRYRVILCYDILSCLLTFEHDYYLLNVVTQPVNH